VGEGKVERGVMRVSGGHPGRDSILAAHLPRLPFTAAAESTTTTAALGPHSPRQSQQPAPLLSALTPRRLRTRDGLRRNEGDAAAALAVADAVRRLARHAAADRRARARDRAAPGAAGAAAGFLLARKRAARRAGGAGGGGGNGGGRGAGRAAAEAEAAGACEGRLQLAREGRAWRMGGGGVRQRRGRVWGTSGSGQGPA
jgi:hypothetical protein